MVFEHEILQGYLYIYFYKKAGLITVFNASD